MKPEPKQCGMGTGVIECLSRKYKQWFLEMLNVLNLKQSGKKKSVSMALWLLISTLHVNPGLMVSWVFFSKHYTLEIYKLHYINKITLACFTH